VLRTRGPRECFDPVAVVVRAGGAFAQGRSIRRDSRLAALATMLQGISATLKRFKRTTRRRRCRIRELVVDRRARWRPSPSWWRGGSCQSGALSAGVSAGAGPFINSPNQVASLVRNAVVGGVASVAGGGKFANGAITGAFGYMFNQCAASPTCSLVGQDPSNAYLAAQGQSVLSDLASFLRENVGMTFYIGGTGEYTRGQGVSSTGGVYFDTRGNFGGLSSATETTGFASGWSGTVGYQLGLESAFRGLGYISYNATTPWGGAGVLTTDSGMFAGMSVSTAGRAGVSEGPTRTCIWGRAQSGC
jgi:hypothetical protein